MSLLMPSLCLAGLSEHMYCDWATSREAQVFNSLFVAEYPQLYIVAHSTFTKHVLLSLNREENQTRWCQVILPAFPLNLDKPKVVVNSELGQDPKDIKVLLLKAIEYTA